MPVGDRPAVQVPGDGGGQPDIAPLRPPRRGRAGRQLHREHQLTFCRGDLCELPIGGGELGHRRDLRRPLDVGDPQPAGQCPAGAAGVGDELAPHAPGETQRRAVRGGGGWGYPARGRVEPLRQCRDRGVPVGEGPQGRHHLRRYHPAHPRGHVDSVRVVRVPAEAGRGDVALCGQPAIVPVPAGGEHVERRRLPQPRHQLAAGRGDQVEEPPHPGVDVVEADRFAGRVVDRHVGAGGKRELPRRRGDPVVVAVSATAPGERAGQRCRRRRDVIHRPSHQHM